MAARHRHPAARWVCAAWLVLAVLAPQASADLAEDVATDLQLSGVDVQSVEIELPPPASGPIDPDAAAQSFSGLKPFLSPDPGAPLPLVKVALRNAPGSPLSGVLATPGLGGASYYDDIPAAMRSELAAQEAVKHAIAGGAELAGLELIILTHDAPAEVAYDALSAAPNPEVFPPRQEFTSLMPKAELEGHVRAALPTWTALGSIEVRVTEDAVGERVVEALAHLPADSLRIVDMGELTSRLDGLQLRLSGQGANIGRVLVTVFDQDSGDPLYASADDVLWGKRRSWYSPLVSASAGGAQAIIPKAKTSGVEPDDSPVPPDDPPPVPPDDAPELPPLPTL